MTIITNKHFSEGTAPAAADLNLVYDALAANTVTANNTGKRWAIRDNLNPGATALNKLFFTDYLSGNSIFKTSSTSLVTVDNTGASPREINPAYTAQNTILFRVCADGTVSDSTIVNFGNGGGGNTEDNLYQFAIKVTYNTSSTVIMCYGNYSFTNLSGQRIANPPAINYTNKCINWRNFSINGIRTFPSGTVINKVELQCMVGNGANELWVERNNLSVIISEN